ncbi:MAG: hypothetical protein U5K76_07895 [Woeseiaceae bacterium]|nr:hypothetical protein [Woeseiaceae bacterium]
MLKEINMERDKTVIRRSDMPVPRGCPRVSAAVRLALGVTAGFVVMGPGSDAIAQVEDAEAIEEITVTGTRIRQPGIESSSPIYSVGAEEIELQAQPEVERILQAAAHNQAAGRPERQ